MTAYDDLMAFQAETEALGQIAGRLGWDQETMMPHGAADQRAAEMAAIEGVLHARRTDPRVGEWLAAATPADDVARAKLRLIRRSFERNSRVPATLASEIARVTSAAQGIWAKARAAEDVASFLPTLEQVLTLKREEAAALADGGDLYDAMLDDYEPGATTATLGAMFDALRPRLVALRERILSSGKIVEPLTGEYGEAGQLAISETLARAFGYSLENGRIDKAVHPFSSGSGLDVRITTRTSPGDPFNCFYSTIHEVGHGSYEQNIDRAYLLTPLGEGASMGIHESQSRIYENQMGRSRAFTGYLYGQMRDVFGDIGVPDAEAFYATVNRVASGYIRTEADEVHYNLHILLRFELERDLISGALEVDALEDEWNRRFKRDFGIEVTDPAMGVLQDVHWSAGLFGYFPTYSLGNLYGACLDKAMRADMPNRDEKVAAAETGPILNWLRERIHVKGRLLSAPQLIEAATGEAPTAEPLLDYLEAKFGALYDL